MIVVGLGTDIVEIERLADVYERNLHFGPRVFSSKELEYCHRHRNCYAHLAARFAAKEAVAKALGKSFSWQDVEIENHKGGRPEVKLHGEAKRIAKGRKVLLTMSHSHSYATAVAMVVED